MPDFAVNIPGVNSALAAQGFDEDAATKAYQATPEGQAMLRAQAEREARLAAYKAANPGASDFQASFYSMTPEEQATFRAMYPGKAGGKPQGTTFTGVAPEAGQSMLDYMLANNGAMPETKLNEGPGLGQALLTAALLAGGGVLTGGALNALMAGGGLGALFGGGAAAAGAPATALGAGTTLVPTITAAGMVPTGTALGAGSAAAQMGAALAAGAGTTGTLAALAPVAAGVGPSVEEVVVIGKLAAAGMSVPQIAAAVGVPALAVNSVLQGSSGLDVAQGGSGGDTVSQPADPNTIDELVITGNKLNPATWTDLVPVGALDSTMIAKGISNGLGAELKPVDKVDPKQIAEGVEKGVDYTVPTAGELLSGPGPSMVDKALEWAKEHPGTVLKAGTLLAGGAAGGAAGGGKTGPSTLPSGVMDAGQPGSTSSLFRSTLPPPSGPFADMSARNVSMTPEEWKTYGQRGQMSFLNSTPVRPSGIIDNSKRADDTNMTPGTGFARGGFAVRGPGTGRSDDIPARLSDGEYVIDAETVALLGDGSTKSGASKLDQFRVNIRKHKGRKLAKGAFSVDAKPPEAYLRGGRA